MTRRVPNWVGDKKSGRAARADSPPDAWGGGPVGGSTRAQATASRALAYGLWTLIGLALVLGLLNCAGNPAAAPRSGEAETDPEPAPPSAGCAELAVAAWLAGDTGLLAGVPGLPRSVPEPGRRLADDTYAVSATPGAEPDSWVYLVAAEVRERSSVEEPWGDGGTQFYTVTLVPSSAGCGGWSPATLPARVSGPTLGSDAEPTYPTGLPTSDTPLSETLAAYFAALLTGTGDLERYTAPGVTVAALDPPPYSQIEIVEIRAHTDTPLDRSARIAADGTVARLLVVVATDLEGADLPLAYPVTVGVRGGRWEVMSTDPATEATASTPLPSPTP